MTNSQTENPAQPIGQTIAIPAKLDLTDDLSTLESGDHQFLVLTSILQTLTDELCRSVAPDLDVPLRELRRRCAFLEPLDRNGNEYQIPPAVRETLLAELNQADSPERLQARHLAAADAMATRMRSERTFSTSPTFDSTIDHYFLSGNPRKAADLLGERVGENVKTLTTNALARFEHVELADYAPHVLTIGMVQGHNANFVAVEAAMTRLEALGWDRPFPQGAPDLANALLRLESLRTSKTRIKMEGMIRNTLENFRDPNDVSYYLNRYQAAYFSYLLGQNGDAMALIDEVLLGHRSLGRSRYTDQLGTFLAVLLQSMILCDNGDQTSARESLAHGETLISEYQTEDAHQVVLDVINLTRAVVGEHSIEERFGLLRGLMGKIEYNDLTVHAAVEIVRLQDQTLDRDGAVTALVELEEFCQGKEVAPLLIDRIHSLRTSFSPPHATLKPHQHLTERERAVLYLLADNSLVLLDIAEKLKVSINTVKSHLRSIHQKFDVSNRDETILFATNAGLLTTVLAWNGAHQTNR